MSYFSKIKSTTKDLVDVLKSKGVEARYLNFDVVEPEILRTSHVKTLP